MGIIKKLTERVLGSKSKSQPDRELLRRCYYEVMEERRVLSADPVVAGITYREGDGGLDTQPDYFEVSFQGGAATTQMTSFTLNGDLDGSGTRNFGDIFFDTTGIGGGGSFPFQFDAANSSGITASDILNVQVSDDGLSLNVELKNFEAGDKFAFSIDVDEMENLRPDMIVSGVEIEGTLFSASFVDENYTFTRKRVELDVDHSEGFIQSQWSGVFFDDYDQIQAEGGRLAKQSLALDADNLNGQANRTAGSIDVYELVAKPIEISGMVYHDENANCERESTESGIGNVPISLQRMDETTGQYVTVASTKTDAQGQYRFGTELNLKPGTFRLVEAQPEGFLSVGAKAGSHGGNIANNAQQHPNVIGQISIPLGGTAATNYDFCEVRPASISGHVWHDANDNGVFDTNEQPIVNVMIQVNRIGAKPGSGPDVFSNTQPIFVRTDANGHYSVTGLPPGIYEVIEINNYPSESSPLTGYIDGKDSLGNIGGAATGTKLNDRFNQIELCAGDAGVRYDFGELKPTSISGFVSLTTPDGDCLDPSDPNHVGISGVRIELYNAAGILVTSTVTNAAGRYEFAGLNPGIYSVVEVQPAGYLDVGQTLGKVEGKSVGSASQDRFSNVVLASGNAGVMYNFCETIPAEICGTVWHDFNDNGVLDSSEQRIGNVKVQLFDENGDLIAETTTDGQGNYCFKDLYPGEYCVKQIQPAGWLDAKDSLGKVGGAARGEKLNDEFCVNLQAGDKGVEYNFGEIQPAEICGTVWHDMDDDGIMESGEERIANVTVQLFDKNGVKVAETVTDAQGNYCFKDLYPGEYCVKQVQPGGWVDAQDSLGKVGGATRGEKTENDVFCVDLRSGDKGIDYNFGEIKLAKISGYVHTDNDQNCIFNREQGDRPLANVTLELLDKAGNVIATTITNQDGAYAFAGLRPGEYSVRQMQPTNYFSGGERVGSGGGQASKNLLSGIKIGSGQTLTEYNFCECEIAEIAGRVWEDGPVFETADGALPANYREQRDGIYTANVDTPIAGSRLYLYHYVSVASDDPDVVELSLKPVTLAEVLPEYYSHLNSANGNAPVWVETGADGQYVFRGLKQGSYVVRQEQPEGYFDANNVPGTTTGFTFNSQGSAQTAPQSVLRTFNTEQIMNSIVNIQVQGGGTSRENNFTEVRVQRAPTVVPPPTTPIIPPIDTPIPRMSNPPGQGPGITGFGGLYGASPTGFTQFAGPPDRVSFRMQSKPADPYTWHLSVINGGEPRNENDGLRDGSSWQQVSHLNNNDWNRFEMGEAVWSFVDTNGKDKLNVSNLHHRFGTIGGTPLTGDFDGDGKDELAVFKDGYWMIDMTANGVWDEQDLLIRFGDFDDRPVIGDWDGDGKDDIGIYGPIWEHDPEAIAHEPGLPNPDNQPHTRPKNVPPNEHEATSRARVMKLTTFGKQRADVVDHVFGVGDGSVIPIAGDWNGNGIRSIGTFKDGSWQLDLNGDGKFDHRDAKVRFGQAGDLPVVGDFNGDGVDEIAIFRAGTWIIDSNGNRELEATDQTFQLGGLGDKPIAGDFDGDGIDQPAIYSERARPVF